MLERSNEVRGDALKVAQWRFDAGVGQINAVDGQGRVLMVIQAGPLFGPRLAAAFTSPAQPRPPAGG